MRRWLQTLADVFVIVMVVVMLSTMGATLFLIVQANQQIREQNEIQICGQAATIVAVRSIAKSLGLPREGLKPPDVSGLDCDALLSRPSG